MQSDPLLTAFQRIGAALLSSLDLDEVLDILAEEVLEAGVFRSLMIALVDGESHTVTVVQSLTKYLGGKGFSDKPHIEYKSLNQRYDLDSDGIVPEVARTGKLEVIVGRDDRLQEETNIGSFENRISYFIPVCNEKETLAVLATGSTVPEREDVLERIKAMQPLLDQVAIAILHARTYTRLKEEISERKASEEKYKSLFENMQTGFALHQVLYDEAGEPEDYIFLDVNKSFESLITLNREQIIGKRISEIMAAYKEDTDGWIRDLAEVDQSGESLSGEYYSRTMRRHYAVNAYKVKPGQVAMVIGDISGKKRLDEEMRKNSNLQSLGVLAGGIAHEFNNMLTGVIGGLSILREGIAKNSPEFEIALLVESSAKKSQALTQQLITFSKGGRPAIETVEIERLVDETVRSAVTGTRTKYTVKFPEPDLTVKADPRQLAQVVDNLSRNAAEAMQNGGSLDVSADFVTLGEDENSSLSPGRYIRISFADNGIGIPVDIIPSIFDPYFTTKQVSQGLGLSIAHSIIQRHGGTIDVESEEGTGTTFRVLLPARSG